MTTFVRIAATALTLVFSGGCAPSLYYFYYLSLTGVDGIEVLEHSVVDAVALFDDPMPTRYRLVRGDYIVEFTLDPSRTGSPSVWVEATLTGGTGLTLERSREDRCDHWRYSDWLGRYMYSWSGVEHCLIEGDEATARQVIGLVLRDGKGNLIGRENLPFEIVRNGVIIGVDAI